MPPKKVYSREETNCEGREKSTKYSQILQDNGRKVPVRSGIESGVRRADEGPAAERDSGQLRWI